MVGMGRYLCGATFTALVFSVAAAGAAAAPLDSVVEQHLEAARRAAGSDLQAPLRLCATARPAPAVDVPAGSTPFVENMKKLSTLPRVGPAKVFDNLYFLGARWSSAWALDTEDGIILLDALDNDEEARGYVVDGLRALHMDPMRIRFIVISHAHTDHFGGAEYLRKLTGAQIVATQADWQEMARFGQPHPFFGAPPKRDPKRDIALNDGDSLVLGSTVVSMHVTPGHTYGTLSPTFDVRDGAHTHRAMLWGGTAFNFGRLPERLQIYSDSARAYQALAQREKVDVVLSNHISFDETEKKLDALQKRAPGGEHPFVIGQDGVQRFLTVADECAQATKASIAPRNWTKQAP